MNKTKLTDSGLTLLKRFCRINDLPEPEIRLAAQAWSFDACAYYRAFPYRINLCIPLCAGIGYGGRAWSYPGYTIDRTPYGVLQHELGHHVDWLSGDRKGKYWSNYSVKMRRRSGEAKMTNYCPNDAEWFAEMFRVFVTNPTLLKALRPRTYELIRSDFKPAEERPWQEVLADAPARTQAQARKKAQPIGETE